MYSGLLGSKQAADERTEVAMNKTAHLDEEHEKSKVRPTFAVHILLRISRHLHRFKLTSLYRCKVNSLIFFAFLHAADKLCYLHSVS